MWLGAWEFGVQAGDCLKLSASVEMPVKDFTQMCSNSEAGSYLRRIDFAYHSNLDLRVVNKKRRCRVHVGFRVGISSVGVGGVVAQLVTCIDVRGSYRLRAAGDEV